MPKKSQQPKPVPQKTLDESIGGELRKILTWCVMAGITLYCLLFLIAPFGPFDQRMTRPDQFLRIDFFTRLIDLDYWKFSWFGEACTFSFFAAFKIIGLAGFIAIGSTGIGRILLRLLRITDSLTQCERFVFSSAVGLSVISTLMLVIGLCGGLAMYATWLILVSIIVISTGIAWFWSITARPSSLVSQPSSLTTHHSSLATWLIFLLAVPSLLILLFGGILPPVEYDVTSYHIPGAKLFYETGRIGFVPNNVYTNMPFAAEMFYVCGMVLTGDWYLGSLVGKLLIAWYTVLAGLGVYCFAARLHSSQAGMIGFLLYVSLPWVSWVSTAGLIDCVFGMYLLLAIFALYLATEGEEIHGRFLYIAGYMAGCAAACKYTAVPFLVLPLCVFALVFVVKPLCPLRFKYLTKKDTRNAQSSQSRRSEIKRAVRTLCFLVLSIVLACGLWYGKNFVATGNPTYPLMSTLFGDRTDTWDAAKNARWQAAHSSTDFSMGQLLRDAKTVLIGSDWLAPVLIPLAVLPFVRRRQNRVLVAMALYLLFYLALWWLLTHRLERFWVPILPIVALLAGIGAMQVVASGQGLVAREPSPQNTSHWPLATSHSPATVFVALLLLFNTCYTFFPNALNAPGKYSRFGFGVEAARLDPMRVASPVILHFNANPPVGKLLFVGDAEVFDYNVPVLYNTCFDDTPFDKLFFGLGARDEGRGVSSQGLRDGKFTKLAPNPSAPSPSSDEIQQRLKEANISHVIVNWSEIARFRSPGNYGYTSDLVQPEVFDRMVQLGVLRHVPADSIPTRPGQIVYEVRGESES